MHPTPDSEQRNDSLTRRCGEATAGTTAGGEQVYALNRLAEIDRPVNVHSLRLNTCEVLCNARGTLSQACLLCTGALLLRVFWVQWG